MKQNDIAILVLIIALSLILSYFIGNAIINTPDNRETEVEVVEPISSEFPVPSEEVFVKDYINPTEIIEIGETNNNQPFNTSN